MEYDKQLNRSDLSLILDNHINQTDHNQFEQSLIDLKNRLFNLEKNDKIPESDKFDLPTLRRQYTMVNGTGFILDMISTLNNKIIKLEKRMSKMGDKTNSTEVKYDL